MALCHTLAKRAVPGKGVANLRQLCHGKGKSEKPWAEEASSAGCAEVEHDAEGNIMPLYCTHRPMDSYSPPPPTQLLPSLSNP